METFSSQYENDYKNKNLVDCKILFWFRGFMSFQNFEIKKSDFKILVFREQNEIRIIMDRKIPEGLVDDLKTLEKSSLNFLNGYINDAVPYINQKLKENKYLTIQIINRPISILDIQGLSIANLKNNEKFWIPWPTGFGDFPFLNTNPKKYDFVYIRDLIDAMTSYLYHDYDECIRKIITSLDNALNYYKTKERIIKEKKKKNEKLYFKKIMDEIVKRPELNYNIKKIYDTRNKIVHEKIRLNQNDDMLCKKGIGTLLYIYKMYLCDSDKLSNYIFQIEMQFNSEILFLRGMKIEHFIQEDDEKTEIIKTPEDLNNSMFNSIKIKDKEISRLFYGNKNQNTTT